MAKAPIMPTSPNVKNATNESGFIPVKYALRYGIYMVPHKIPAASAATTPRDACDAEPGAADAEATASIHAPRPMTRTPPKTPAQRRQPACLNSLKKINPHKIPSRLFEFQSGNAMLRPTSRIAKIVNVFATAQRHPASTAQMIKWGARRTSARTAEVPRITAGTLHRARKTPITMISEITTGEIPTDTNFVGASAAPSQAPAVNPESMPTTCSLRPREAAVASTAGICELRTVFILSRVSPPSYRIARNKTNPAISTNTGTQNWASVNTLLHRLNPCSRSTIRTIVHYLRQKHRTGGYHLQAKDSRAN